MPSRLVGAVADALDPRQQVAPLGPQRPRRPDLLAGDAVPVAVGHRPGLHAGEVGAGVGLAEPLAPEPRPAAINGRCNAFCSVCRSGRSTDRSSWVRSTAPPRGSKCAHISSRMATDDARSRSWPPYSAGQSGTRRPSLADTSQNRLLNSKSAGLFVNGPSQLSGSCSAISPRRRARSAAHMVGVFVDKGVRGVVGCHPRPPKRGRGTPGDTTGPAKSQPIVRGVIIGLLRRLPRRGTRG